MRRIGRLEPDGRAATPNEGQVIEYEEVSNRGKISAENLRFQR